MISVCDATTLIRFSPAEKQLLQKIANVVDDTIAREYSTGKLAGAPLRLELQEAVDPKIAYAIKRDYEPLGWQVSVLGVAPLSLQFSPTSAVMTAAPTVKAKREGLPPIVRVEAPTQSASKRLLVRMPTRSRPEQALEVLTRYRALAGIPITIEVIIDEDDASMMAAPVLQRLAALGCIVTVGQHKTKVEACNGGRVDEWDILLLASDDMLPVVDGYARRIVEEMERAWPHLDGALYFFDGVRKDLVTLPIFGRRFYDQFGFVYNPAYKSLWCDTEQTALWTKMGRLACVEEMIIEHRHHVWGKAEKDALYLRNDSLFSADKEVYDRREARGFDYQPPTLAVCIATLPERAPRLKQLVDELYRQRDRFLSYDASVVEIVIDAGEGNVGEKRNRLLECAKAHFVAFVDDDDLVAWNYLSRIVDALHAMPEADCVALTGVMTTAGATPETFVHSMRNNEWRKRDDGVYERGINHLCPVRRELALQAGFPSLNHAEDFDYATRLKPLLKTQADITGAPSYFYLFEPSKGETGGAIT